jgi:hypothetical protein
MVSQRLFLEAMLLLLLADSFLFISEGAYEASVTAVLQCNLYTQVFAQLFSAKSSPINVKIDELSAFNTGKHPPNRRAEKVIKWFQRMTDYRQNLLCIIFSARRLRPFIQSKYIVERLQQELENDPKKLSLSATETDGRIGPSISISAFSAEQPAATHHPDIGELDIDSAAVFLIKSARQYFGKVSLLLIGISSAPSSESTSKVQCSAPGLLLYIFIFTFVF